MKGHAEQSELINVHIAEMHLQQICWSDVCVAPCHPLSLHSGGHRNAKSLPKKIQDKGDFAGLEGGVGFEDWVLR